MNSNDFTICFWVKTDSEGHLDASGNPKGHFVMGLGAFFGFQYEILVAMMGLNLQYNINLLMDQQLQMICGSI